MKTLARRTNGAENATSREAQGLQRALDQSYAKLRTRAMAEWQRYHTGRDPSDACVRVRIGPDGRQQALTF
ncbi:MAG TPA: hypothetical protein VGL24_09235 [Chthoniobacterales bacterium]|jgi:hypothetical protein